MKKLILFFSIIAFSTISLSAQTELHNKFENDLKKYTVAFNHQQWNTVCDMMYPPIFKMMSKENMIMIMEQMNNLGVKMTTQFLGIDHLSKVVKHGNLKYCDIQYNGKIKVVLSGLMSQGSALLQPQFEKEFGKENVTYKEKENIFLIQAKRSMIAIAPKKSNEWKYIDINSPQAKGLKGLVPHEVQKQLKK